VISPTERQHTTPTTDIHAPGRIRNPNRGLRTAADTYVFDRAAPGNGLSKLNNFMNKHDAERLWEET